MAASKEAAFFVPDTFVVLIATAVVADLLTGRTMHEKSDAKLCLCSILVVVL